MLRRVAMAMVAAAWAQVAAAEVFVSADGAIYAGSVNESGTVLRGRGETIYLGRACDALVDGLGYGRWGWSSAGTLVMIGRHTVVFPQQIPDLSPGRCLL